MVSKPKALGIVLVAVILLAVIFISSRREYRLGDVHLKLPPEASVQGVPLWIRMLPGIDNSSREMLVLLPADYIAAHVPGYVVQDGQVREDVLLLITALTDEELERYRHDPQIQKMAARTDMFEGRQAAYDQTDHAWHVFAEGGPSMFALMRIDPGTTNNLAKLKANLLGYCITMEMTATETGKTWSCDSDVVVGHLSAGFHYGPKNLKNYDALAAFLRQSLSKWMADAR